MKKHIPATGIYALLFMLTFGYVCAIRLSLSAFNILYNPTSMGEMHLLSKVTASTGALEVWQVLAWISFILSVVWGLLRAKQGTVDQPFVVPWIMHISWIMTAFFWHVVGALNPMVMPIYSIG